MSATASRTVSFQVRSRRSFSAGGALAVSAMAGEALRISDTVVASWKGSVSHG
jgi:hypothetical protein